MCPNPPFCIEAPPNFPFPGSYHESFKGPIKWVQEEAGQWADLGSAIPAIRAVH